VARLVRLIDRLTGLVGQGGAWLVVPLFGVMTWEVVARFCFNLPTFWAYELAYMMTGAHFVLGIALVLRRGQHIRIDFLHAGFPPRLKAALDAVVYVCFLLPVVSWMTWRLVEVALRAYLEGEVSGESAWNPVIWPLRTVLAVGFALFGLQIFAETCKCVGVLLFPRREPES